MAKKALNRTVASPRRSRLLPWFFEKEQVSGMFFVSGLIYFSFFFHRCHVNTGSVCLLSDGFETTNLRSGGHSGNLMGHSQQKMIWYGLA